MSESPPDPRREVALFRFKVIAGLLRAPWKGVFF